MTLIKMQRPDGHTADVHPDMVDDYRKGGYDPIEAVATDIPSKSDIATMKKADCVEWLEAHGADTDGTIAELRSRLRAVMYLEG